MRCLPVVLAIAAATGCGGGDDSVVESDGLAVIEAWARPTPPGVGEAAIYITIENRGAPDDRLIGFSSDRCMVMAPHLTVISDDIASMGEADEDSDELALSRGAAVVMEPNGLHAMCLGLADPLVAGDEFDVVLQFGDHSPFVTPVTVRQR